MNLKWMMGAGGVAFAPAAVVAATLTTVPMQGGMVMPMIAYHAEHGHLHVMMPTEVPQLTPLLVSHPGDRFDPADPWFDDLDPSRKGLSFSRRYGFVMAVESDPLPPDTRLWLRKRSGPPDLGFYRYSASEPKRWEPIFGTAGSPDTLEWNGLMFHPAVTAPPAAAEYTAVFEAYLVDTRTGAEIPDSHTDPMVFRFTNVPDGRPTLRVTRLVAVSWPAETTGWVLEQAAQLPAAEWIPVAATPVLIEGQPTVLLEPGAERRFYRMRPVP